MEKGAQFDVLFTLEESPTGALSRILLANQKERGENGDIVGRVFSFFEYKEKAII